MFSTANDFSTVIRPPGTVVPGRPYVLQQFFIFFQCEISEVSDHFPRAQISLEWIEISKIEKTN